jgi:hypothetical protein
MWLLTGMRFPALDPAVTDHRVVLQMRRVHEHEYIVLIAGLLEVFVLFEERLRSGGIGFSGDEFRLLVDVAETAQYRRHPARGVTHVPALFDPACRRLCRQMAVPWRRASNTAHWTSSMSGFAHP